MTYIPGNGGSGGNIASLGDVALNNVANGQVLTFDTSLTKWVNASTGVVPSAVAVKRLSASVTLGETDANAYLRVENPSGEVVITVPHSSVWNPPVGTTLTVRRRGDGIVRISAVDPSIVFLFPDPSAGTFTITQTHATVSLIKIDTDAWDIEGMFA